MATRKPTRSREQYLSDQHRIVKKIKTNLGRAADARHDKALHDDALDRAHSAIATVEASIGDVTDWLEQPKRAAQKSRKVASQQEVVDKARVALKRGIPERNLCRYLRDEMHVAYEVGNIRRILQRAGTLKKRKIT